MPAVWEGCGLSPEHAPMPAAAEPALNIVAWPRGGWGRSRSRPVTTTLPNAAAKRRAKRCSSPVARCLSCRCLLRRWRRATSWSPARQVDNMGAYRTLYHCLDLHGFCKIFFNISLSMTPRPERVAAPRLPVQQLLLLFCTKNNHWGAGSPQTLMSRLL